MFRFIKVFSILFLVVQTTVSPVISEIYDSQKHYDDFCLVGELSGRRFVISNGKFDGDFTFYSHSNVKVIDEWSSTTIQPSRSLVSASGFSISSNLVSICFVP